MKIEPSGDLDRPSVSRGKMELVGSLSIAAQQIHNVADTDEILYAECLARLTDAHGVVHRASAFAPQLERKGRSFDLDYRMLDMVTTALAADGSVVLGSNLSAENLSDANRFSDILSLIVSRARLASRLILEITETHPLTDAAIVRLKMLQALGCRVAVDDFGTGYSTPANLLRIPADIVKIDGSFVHDIRQAEKNCDSLYHMVAFASCVAPVIVVEGIETASQLRAARAAGGTHVQGFLLSMPSRLAMPKIQSDFGLLEGE